MSFEINGNQINIQTVIVGDSLKYSHYYEILFGHDLNDDTKFNSKCFPNPCKNGGTCQIGSSKEYSCLCPPGLTGKNTSLNGKRILIDLLYKGETCQQIITDVTDCVVCNVIVTNKGLYEITTTTTTTILPEGLCKPNPCENNGICRLSRNNDSYSCFCKTNYTGKLIIYFQHDIFLEYILKSLRQKLFKKQNIKYHRQQ